MTIYTKLFSCVILLIFGALFYFLVWTQPSPCGSQMLNCSNDETEFDGYDRNSQYISLPNGRRIAVDVLRPTKSGELVKGPMPVLFTQTVYNRAAHLVKDYKVQNSTLIDTSGIKWLVLKLSGLFVGGEYIADQTMMVPWTKKLIQDGYIVVAADAAGTGASFGNPHRSVDGYVEDANLMMDWIIAQPWSNGRIGVYGQSFGAYTAYTALATHHRALKAAFVASVPLHPYETVGYPNGLYAKGFAENYIALTDDLDNLATVTNDEDAHELLTKAIANRSKERFSDQIADIFRSSPNKEMPSKKYSLSWAELSAEPIIERAANSNVPVFVIGGWLDMFINDTIEAHNLNKAPSRLVLRPWHHHPLFQPFADMDPAADAQLWFDIWLKEKGTYPYPSKRVDYFQHSTDVGVRDQGQWCNTESWPIEGAVQTRLELQSVAGSDAQSAPITGKTGTSGINSRWNGVLGTGIYASMQELNPDALQIETALFKAPVEIAGNMSVTFQLQNMLSGTAIHAILEHVSSKGQANYLAEAMTRISAEQSNVKMRFLPVAVRMQKGERMRITLLNSDIDNYKSSKEVTAKNRIWMNAQSAPALMVSEKACSLTNQP